MANRKYQPPYHTLGKYLKTMRQRLQETLGETSGAVEIDVAVLDKIERGEELPSEDILLLLISHFGLQDDEAVELWQLAGYDKSDSKPSVRHEPNGHVIKQPPVMLLALDNRVMYSNNAEILCDDAGVMISFGQYMDSTQPPLPVARVGMSYEQAEKVLATLQHALLRHRYEPRRRLLPDASAVPPTTPETPNQPMPEPPRPNPGQPEES